jgi:hypothetical protein
MYASAKSGLETQAQRRELRVVLFALAVVLAVPARAYCYSVYSSTSVGSDGTVYGWGVTDGTPPPGYSMTHTAYVWTSLTSPKGRSAASGPSGTYTYGVNYVSVEVSLPFDPTDTGTYTTQSFHGVW